MTISTPPNDRLAVTISEATRMTGISRSSIYRLMAAGRLAAVKLAGRTLIPMAALHTLIDTAQPATVTYTG